MGGEYSGLVPMDYAFIDGTFFADGEIPRLMSEGPTRSSLLRYLSTCPRPTGRRSTLFILTTAILPERHILKVEAAEALGFHFAEFGLEVDL